jgi:putative transcriptional regulator
MDAGFILYCNETADRYSIEIKPGIYLSRDSRLLEDISQGKGPKDFLFMLGYAGWGAGQLETELIDNSWLTVPGDVDVLFHTPDAQKWRLAAQKFGIDISIFGDIIGYA